MGIFAFKHHRSINKSPAISLKNLLVIFMLLSMSHSVLALEYVMRTITIANLSPTNTPPNNDWQAASQLTTAWVNAGAPYACTTWMPLASTRGLGSAFTQSQTCSQDQERTVTSREYNAITDEYRVTGSEIESQTLTITQQQQATGTASALFGSVSTALNSYSKSAGTTNITGPYDWVTSLANDASSFEVFTSTLTITLESKNAFEMSLFLWQYNLTGPNANKYPRNVTISTFNSGAWTTHGTVSMTNSSSVVAVNLPFYIPKRSLYRFEFTGSPESSIAIHLFNPVGAF